MLEGMHCGRSVTGLVAFSILLAAEERLFDRVKLLEDKGEASAGISIGDLNGDGRIDLVMAKGRHGPLHDRILLNDGKGGYVASNLGPEPDRTYSAALADVDLDGDLDVVVSNDTPDRKLVYKNNGKGKFQITSSFGEPKWVTRYVTLADLNGDKYPDVVVANRGGDTKVSSFVCLNDGKGAFGACKPLPAAGSATSIVAADLDGDGAIDLFVPYRDRGQSLVWWNDGKGNFAESTKVGPPDTAARIGAAGDLNGDGSRDLMYIDEAKKAAFYVLNRGKREFGEPVMLPGAKRTPYALALADLDHDRQLDIVIGFVELPGAVYFNQDKGKSFEESPWNDGQGVVYDIAFADVDGDGEMDILAARSGAPNGIWFGRKR